MLIVVFDALVNDTLNKTDLFSVLLKYYSTLFYKEFRFMTPFL